MKVFGICLLVFWILVIISVPISFVYGWNQTETKVEPEINIEPTDSNEIELIDSDNDGMNDWFEENIAYTNPDVYNARFVIIFWVSATSARDAPVPDDSNSYIDLIDFFTEKEEIPAENCFFLIGNWQNGATVSNLRNAIQSISQRADEESFVFVSLGSHGGGEMPEMWGADGNGYEYGDSILYEEVGRMLNVIECRAMLVEVVSCAEEAAVEPLAKEATYPRVVVWGGREIIGAIGEDSRYYSISDIIYGNGNGYVSLLESINFTINDYDLHSGAGDVEKWRQEEKVISDKWNLASDLYLGDYIPPGYAENKIILTIRKEAGRYYGWYDADLGLKE